MKATSRSSVLVLPGYLLDSRDYVPLVSKLRDRGYNAALPAIRWYNWLPTVGGRSLRPILDRIDYSVRQLAAGYEADEATSYEIKPSVSQSFADFVQELKDPSEGARPVLVPPNADKADRIALVGCSASGWISRIYLGSGPPYGDRVYSGSKYVHTLVTLGSPHICNEGITKDNIAFVNTNYPGAFESEVAYFCVAGRAVQGKTYLSGLIKDFAYQSYELCSKNGLDWGDGVTPVSSAIGLDGAKTLVLDDVLHSPTNKGVWYGSDEALDQWFYFLKSR